MNIGGIIAEYNPFHNGHRYQIEQFRKTYDISHLVVVMSGNYVQRGDVAIIDKFSRSRMAIQGGADLVIELPVPYVLSTAEYFALGGVYLLDSLGCIDSISFGSSTDIQTLTNIANLSKSLRNSPEVLELLNHGDTFPTAINKVMCKAYGDEISNILSDPNNVLGLEYIRALNRLHSNIQPTTLPRKNVHHHSSTPIDTFASASTVRNMILSNEDYSKYIPEYCKETLSSREVSKIQNLEKTILYKLRTSTAEDIQAIFDVSHGLEHRILQSTKNATTLEDLLFSIKTKRYTLSRIRRIILNLTLGITKQDIAILPPYARVLAMNSKGVEILSKAKKTCNIPIGTSLAKLEKLSLECNRFATLESTSTDIYSLSTDKTLPCGLDYTHKICVL
jgi:predicted nucleotidyltransferase